MLTLDELINEISEKTENNAEEVKKMIEEKQDELSGLVSEEGAAYIVAKELGLELLEEKIKNLKVKDIVPGMFSIDIRCKIAKITDIRNFERNGVKGAVQNILMGDETGLIRMSIWNEEIEKFKEMGITEGVIIKLLRVISKEDNLGKPEIRLGRKGQIEKTTDNDIMLPASATSSSFDSGAKEMTIDELKPGMRAIIKGTLIQVFKRKPYYEVCGKCGARIEKMNDKWFCKSCGETESKFSMLVSGIIDDGYGNIRAVFFRENAENILGLKASDIENIVKNGGDPLTIYDDSNLIGKIIKVTGSVKMNDFTGNIEMFVNNVDSIDVHDESADITQKIDKINELE